MRIFLDKLFCVALLCIGVNLLSGCVTSLGPGINKCGAFKADYITDDGAFGCIENELAFETQNQTYGARIIHLGDTTTLLIPADFYFGAKDDILLYDVFNTNHPLLNQVAWYLNQFGNSAIKIGVGTDDVDTRHRNYILSKRQAYRIAGYLWKRGVDAWRLYPVSYGPDMLLATNRTIMGSYRNRMIEITTNPNITPADCCENIAHFISKNQPWQFWGLPYARDKPYQDDQ